MQLVRLPPRRHELDRTDHTDHTDHTHHTYHESISSESSRQSWSVDNLSDVWSTCVALLFCVGQVFQVARRAGFAPEAVQLQHVPFGLVQGAVMQYLPQSLRLVVTAAVPQVIYVCLLPSASLFMKIRNSSLCVPLFSLLCVPLA